MFNQTKYNLLIQSIKQHFNFNEKESNRFIYNNIHDLLMNKLITKYNKSDLEIQIAISKYNLKQHF